MQRTLSAISSVKYRHHCYLIRSIHHACKILLARTQDTSEKRNKTSKTKRWKQWLSKWHLTRFLCNIPYQEVKLDIKTTTKISKACITLHSQWTITMHYVYSCNIHNHKENHSLQSQIKITLTGSKLHFFPLFFSHRAWSWFLAYHLWNHQNKCNSSSNK